MVRDPWNSVDSDEAILVFLVTDEPEELVVVTTSALVVAERLRARAGARSGAGVVARGSHRILSRGRHRGRRGRSGCESRRRPRRREIGRSGNTRVGGRSTAIGRIGDRTVL